MTAIVFDLDGTLIHSAPDIQVAINRTLAEFGRAGLPLDLVTSFIGNGVQTLIERVIGATWLDPALHGRMVGRFLEHYDAAPADLTRPYDGVVEALERLRDRGHRLGVCTNKPHEPALAILGALGMSRHFDAVIGGDSLPVKKPDPAPLLAAFRELGAAEGIYVGDSEVDAACALAASVPFLLFTGGYRKKPVGELPHLAAFDHFGELPGLTRTAMAA